MFVVVMIAVTECLGGVVAVAGGAEAGSGGSCGSRCKIKTVSLTILLFSYFPRVVK